MSNRSHDPFSFSPEKREMWKSRIKRYLSQSGLLEEKMDLLICLIEEDITEVIRQRFSEQPKSQDVIHEPISSTSGYQNAQQGDSLGEKSIAKDRNQTSPAKLSVDKGTTTEIEKGEAILQCDNEDRKVSENLFVENQATLESEKEKPGPSHNSHDQNHVPNATTSKNTPAVEQHLGITQINIPAIKREMSELWSNQVPDNNRAPQVSDNISVHEMSLKMETDADDQLSATVGNNNITISLNESANPEVNVRTPSKKQKIATAVKTENNNDSNAPIDALSDQILLNIFEYLPILDLITTERVCKRWQKISLKFWKQIKDLDIKNAFQVKAIHLDNFEKILKRCGKYVTRLHCSFLNESVYLPARPSMEMISKYCKQLNNLNICNTWSERNYLCALDFNLIRKLTSISVGINSGFSDDDLPALLEVAKDLEEFYIVGYDYPNGSNPLLKLSKKCKLLGITNTKKFTDDMLKELLSTHPKIEHLDISETNITREALAPIKDSLKSLALWCMPNFFKVAPENGELLNCPQLRKLDMNYNNRDLTGKILSNIVDNCPAIEDLRLQGAAGKKINADDFLVLKKLRNLRYLDVSNTKITNSELISIAKGTGQLKMLICHGCSKVTAPGLVQVVIASPQLMYLGVTSTDVTKSFIEKTFDALQKRTTRVGLVISLKAKTTAKIKTAVKKIKIEKRLGDRRRGVYLRVADGLSVCECNFNETCTCYDEEQKLLYFD